MKRRGDPTRQVRIRLTEEQHWQVEELADALGTAFPRTLDMVVTLGIVEVKKLARKARESKGGSNG